MKLALSQSGLSCGAASAMRADHECGVISDTTRREAEKQDADEQENQSERDEEKVFPDGFKRFFGAVEKDERHEAERCQLQDDPKHCELLDDQNERVRQQVKVQRGVKEALGTIILRPLHPLEKSR